ncbi:Kelch repeat-containing protein [Phenylobacterium sp. VNQ135]|uniref:Kelch repeat-containing protein n=1 Tax=Phenylobacterium sp. VNQ135 TaxID=3400922 RepID=UPI003C0E7600
MIDRRAVLSAASVFAAPGLARAVARWEPCVAVPWTVQEVYGAALGDRIVIAGGMSPGAGGLGGGINPQDRTGIYDPTTDRWTEGPKLPFARHHPVLAAARGRAYAFGGYRVTDAGGWVAIPDALVLGEDGWTAVARMPKLQCETVAVTLGDRVHIASGRAPKGEANRNWNDQGDIALHQVFDVRSGRWSTAAPCPEARNSATGAVIDGLFYLAGGRRVGEGNSARLDRYDPKTDRWETLRPMPRASGGLAGAAAGGRLYVFGGENPGVIPETWSYDPKTDQWRQEPGMRTPRHGLAAAAVRGRIYAIGGGAKASGGQVTAIVEALVP